MAGGKLRGDALNRTTLKSIQRRADKKQVVPVSSSQHALHLGYPLGHPVISGDLPNASPALSFPTVTLGGRPIQKDCSVQGVQPGWVHEFS